MKKAVCKVMAAAIRKESNDQAEMLTQLLFGETMTILDFGKYWAKIKMDFDDCEGYVDTRQIEEITDEQIANRKTNLVKEKFISTKLNDDTIALLSLGSEIDFPIDSPEKSEAIKTRITNAAQDFLNIPFLWGGRSFFGVDSGSLVQLVYKINAIRLPRYPNQQSEKGEVLSFIEESESGDLAFFENESGEINHVGIMLEDQKIIHASGKVRIDTLDSTGIFNQELNQHTHKLRFVKRIL